MYERTITEVQFLPRPAFPVPVFEEWMCHAHWNPCATQQNCAMSHSKPQVEAAISGRGVCLMVRSPCIEHMSDDAHTKLDTTAEQITGTYGPPSAILFRSGEQLISSDAGRFQLRYIIFSIASIPSEQRVLTNVY